MTSQHGITDRSARSLRLKLVALAIALVTVPAGIFGVIASRDASRALATTVGEQLRMVSGDVARDLDEALAEQRGKMRGWAHQDVMREIIVRDVDKRIATFLWAQQAGDSAYLDLFVVDTNGTTVASSDPRLIGVSPPPADGWREALTQRDVVVMGPVTAPHLGKRVLELATPIVDPESATTVLGVLLALYDWDKLMAMAGDTSRELAAAGIVIDLRVLDVADRVIGAASADGVVAVADAVFAADADTLVGRARLDDAAARWTVVALQARAAALAPVRHMHRRLALALALVLLAGIVAATILAGRMTRPLESLTDAARRLARGTPPDPLPVRSNDEIGVLTSAFNAMAADLRQAEQDLVAAAKLASVGEIAAGLAHEIRTPLGIMRGSAQMLGRARGDVDRRTHELVDMIVGEVDRLERLVAALTELGRPHEPAIEETALAPLLKRALDFIDRQASSQRVTLAPALDASVRALCDPDQIYQVALNLLVNALHVMPHGGRIRVRTFGHDHGRAGFEVADDGPGIAPELQKQIFTPFFTRREGGTGLGLAFVARVVVAHQGRVSVRSVPGEGATFRVELPAVEEAA